LAHQVSVETSSSRGGATPLELSPAPAVCLAGSPAVGATPFPLKNTPPNPFFAIRAADGVNGAADGAIRVADGASGTPDGAIGSANGAIGVANGVIGVADGAVFSIGKTNFERGGTIRPLVYPAFALKNPVLPPIRPLPLFLLVNLNKITNE
jgi:hypothetical protein